MTTYPVVRDEALERIDNALARMLMRGEVVKAIDVSIVVVPTPHGMACAVQTYIAMSSPVLGGNDLSMIDHGYGEIPQATSQAGIDVCVRRILENLRQMRAKLLAAGNGAKP